MPPLRRNNPTSKARRQVSPFLSPLSKNMIIFLYGPDTYRSRQKLGEIVEHYKEVHKSGLNLRFFDCQSSNCQDFNDEFRQSPMFHEKKLIILKNVFQNQDFKNYFLENGKKLADSKDNIIFYEEGEIAPKEPLLKFLIKNAKTQEFKMLAGGGLRGWAQKELKKYGAKIQPEALQRLINCVGDDLWRFSGEIQKLAAFKKNKTIGIEDVDLLVGARLETDIFKTIEAIALRNKKQALSLLHEHLEKGDSPLYLLSMISFQFRNLLIIKKTGRLDSHPYFVRKTAFLAKSFTFEELKKIYGQIFEADVKIKTGRIDPQTALDLLVIGT